MSANNYLQENICQLWKEEECTDLLVVAEGKEFKCHSVVLCACSDFFKAMMRTKMKESEERAVHLRGITAETFSAILESMYTCVINLNHDNIFPMWFASHRLQMKHVMKECEKFVINECLTVETCASFYYFANRLSAEEIVAKSKTCILEKFEQLVKTDSYLDSSFDEIFEIVNFEDLKIQSEDPVVEFILKWVCHVPMSTRAPNDGDSSSVLNQEDEDDGQNGAIAHLAYQKEGRNIAQTSASSEPETSNVCHIVQDDNASKGNSVSQGPGQDVSADDHVCATEELSEPFEKENTKAVDRSPALMESADVTSDSGKPPNTGCSKKENVAEKVEGGDQHSVETKDTSITEEESTHTKYPRAEYLQRLLHSARICLASKGVLEDLLKHELVKTDTELYKYVFDSLLYNLDVGRRHGSWPEAAYRRRSSGKKHVMVFVESNCNDVKAYSLDDGSVWTKTTLPNDDTQKTPVSNLSYTRKIPINHTQKYITVFDNNLLLSTYSLKEDCYVMMVHGRRDRWQILGGQDYMWFKNNCLVAHHLSVYSHFKLPDEVSYIEMGFRQDIYCRCALDGKNGKISAAIPFGKYIILFENHTINALDTTASMRRRKLDSIDGPMENIISFTAHDNTYILQRNGKMWKILLKDSAEKVAFESVNKLWDFDWELYGGIFYKGKLFIFGNTHSGQRDGQSRQTSVPGIFGPIEYVFINSCTQCVPMVIFNK